MRTSMLSGLCIILGLVMACDPPGPRPCRADDQCEADQRCAIDDGDDVGRCAAEGEGEGEGEGPGEGEGEGEDEGDGSRAEAVDVGGVFACAIDGLRRVQCWGGNSRGQLGRQT